MSSTGTCAMNGPALHDDASDHRLLAHRAAAHRRGRAGGPCPGPYGAGRARDTAADSDTAELLTAELVANAVEHTVRRRAHRAGGGAAAHRLPDRGARRGPGAARRSHGAGPAEEPDPWQEHGRGLLLIRTLSSSCGHRPTEPGQGGVVHALPASLSLPPQ